jgi:predicted nucleic acid-binding protein
VIHLDSSILVDALTGPRRSAAALRHVIAEGERIGMCALVLYEWRRGPRHDAELHVQEQLLPSDVVFPFDAAAAARAADLYRRVKRPRGREIDLAIAACAMAHGARFWTLNAADFRDVPDLVLYEPVAP